eukprot:403331763
MCLTLRVRTQSEMFLFWKEGLGQYYDKRILFPNLIKSCAFNITLTGFDVDQRQFIAVTGLITLEPSCPNSLEQSSSTFACLFDNQGKEIIFNQGYLGTTNVFKEVQQNENFFTNPLIKPSGIIMINLADGKKLQILSLEISEEGIQERSLELIESSSLFQDKNGKLTDFILVQNPTGSLNILTFCLTNAVNEDKQFILQFDDHFTKRKLSQVVLQTGVQDQKILTFVFFDESSLLINLQYRGGQDLSIIQQSVLKLGGVPITAIDYQLTWKTHNQSIRDSQIKISQFSTQQWYMIQKVELEEIATTNVIIGVEQNDTLRLQNVFEIDFQFLNLNFEEISYKQLLISGFMIPNYNDKVPNLILRQNELQASILYTIQNELGEQKQQLIYIKRIDISENQIKDKLKDMINNEERTIALNVIEFTLNQSSQALVQFEDVIEEFQLNYKVIKQDQIGSDIGQLQEDIIKNQAESRLLTTTYTLSDGTQTANTISYTISAAGTTTKTLSLVDNLSNPITISKVTYGDNSDLTSQNIPMTYNAGTNVFSITLTTTHLQVYSGVRTLNVQTSISSVDTTVAYIQVEVIIPDTVNNGDVNNVTAAISSCRATMNPYYFGNYLGNFGEITLKYINADIRGAFMIAGDSSQPPFHDGSTTITGGFFGLLKTNAEPFWIFRVQEDYPTASAQTSSCYLLSEISSHIYTICNVRNLDSATLERRNIIIKVTKANGKFVHMRHIYQESATTTQEALYLTGLSEANKFMIGLSYQDTSSSPKTFQLIKISDSLIASYTVQYHKAYTFSDSFQSTINIVYKPSKTGADESHLAFVQRPTTSSLQTQIFDLSTTDLSVTRGVTFNAELKSSTPCNAGMSPDATFYFPCVLIPSVGATKSKLYGFKINLTGQSNTIPSFDALSTTSQGISIELPGDVSSGQMIFLYSTRNQSNVVQFVGTSVSTQQLFTYTFNVQTFFNQSIQVWNYGIVLPNAQFSLVRTISNQPQTIIKYYGITGKLTPSSKQSSMVITTYGSCMNFQGVTIGFPNYFNNTSADPQYLISAYVTNIATLSTHITTSTFTVSTTQASFTSARKIKLTTQSYQTDLSLKYQWGQGSLSYYWSSATNFSTRLCGGYDYSNDTQDFQYLDINENTALPFEHIIKEPFQCQQRPLDLYVFSPQIPRTDPNPILQSWITVYTDVSGNKVLKLNPFPVSNFKGQQFNLNITYVDRYDGRIMNEFSYVIRFNRDNSLDYPTTSYFECPQNLFPLSFGDSCTDSNCGLIVKSQYYDQPTNTLLLMGGVQSGFSKLIDQTKGTHTDAFIMKTNAFGIVLWMNQIRSQSGLSEHASSATVYNDTYVIVAIRTDITDPSYTSVEQFSQVFSKFNYITGQYNGTITFNRVNTIISPNYISSIIAEVAQFVSISVSITNQPTLYRIMASVMFRQSADTTKQQPGFIIFQPVISINSTYVLNLQSTIPAALATNSMGSILLQGNIAYYAIVYDSVAVNSIQYLNMIQVILNAVGSATFINLSARLTIASEQTNKIMKPPVLLDTGNGNIIVTSIVYKIFKVIELVTATFVTTREYNVLFSSVIYQYTFVQMPNYGQFALVTNEMAASDNTDGLLIVIFSSTFTAVQAYKTGIQANSIPQFFSPFKLSPENGLYYVYGVTNFAFDTSTSGNEIFVGYINFNSKIYDDNECLNYKTITTIPITSTTQVTPPQQKASTQFGSPIAFGIYEIYTPLVWQIQYGNDRQIMPKRKKADKTFTGVTFKDQCSISSDAITEPHNSVLLPVTSTLGSLTSVVKTSSSVFSSTKNCQGLSTSTQFDTTVDAAWKNQNEFLTLAAGQITVDSSKDQNAPGIREIKMTQCLNYNTDLCNDQYLPLALLPNPQQPQYSEQAYGCTDNFPNEYPKVLGSEDSNFFIYGKDYDSTNNKIVVCGKQEYNSYQNVEFQTFQSNGIIILFQTYTGQIQWTYSLTSLLSTYDESSFSSCLFSLENSIDYVISLVFIKESEQNIILKQRVSDGLYTQAYFFTTTFAFQSNGGLYIDRSTSEIYVYPNSKENKVNQIFKLAQYTRGFIIKWEYYITPIDNSYKKFPIQAMTKFNSQLYYSGQMQFSASSYITIFQSLSTFDGSNLLFRSQTSSQDAQGACLVTDNTYLVYSYVSATNSGTDYTKTIVLFNIVSTVTTYVTSKQYAVTKVDAGSRTDTIISGNNVYDAFYFNGGQLYIAILNKVDLAQVVFKKFDQTATNMESVFLAAKSSTELYLFATSKKLLNADITSGMIHKLGTNLVSDNSCFSLTDISDVTINSFTYSSNALTVTYNSILNSIRLLPATDLYLESKVQYRDVNFRLASYLNCKHYALEFYEDLPQVDIEVDGTAQTVMIDKTDLCSSATIKVTVDYYMEIPTFIGVDYKAGTANPITITITPTEDDEVGLYSVRISYAYNSINNYRNMVINVKPSTSPTIDAGVGIEVPSVLFHLHKEGAIYFIAGDIQSDSTYYVICGHRMLFFQQAFFQQYDLNQKLLFQHNLGSGLYDSYSVDCKYSSDDDLYNMVNSFTASDRLAYSIYLYKHDLNGYFVNSKQLIQIGQNIFGDGFIIGEDSLIVFGRTSGLLSYTETAPFFMRLSTDFDVKIYKTIKYSSESTIKSLALNADDNLFGVMGTKDSSNSNTKSWIIMSFNPLSFYEQWSYVLKDTNSAFACIYYQYSYTATTQYEAALIRVKPSDGTIANSIEWEFDEQVQSCEIEEFTSGTDQAIAVTASISTQTYINLFKITATAVERLTTSTTSQVFTLNFDTITNIRHRLRYRQVGGTDNFFFVFSSVYYTTLNYEKIGRQFLTTINMSDLNSIEWNDLCDSVTLQNVQASTFVTDTLLEPTGVATYTQSTKWVNFDMESKMISNVYIDTFFYFNPQEVLVKTLTSSSDTFVDYRSIYKSDNSQCTVYSKPVVETPAKYDFIGEETIPATSNGGITVKLGTQEIDLATFKQNQGYDLIYLMKSADGSALPTIFRYDQIEHKLIIVADSNDDVDTYDLELIAKLAIDPTVFDVFTFKVEILANKKPTFKTATSTASSVQFKEDETYEIFVEIDTDPESDNSRILGAELQDQSGNVIDKDWFTITKISLSSIKIKLVKPSVLSNTEYNVVVQAADIFNLFDPATYKIKVTVTNENHKPYLKTDSDTDLGTWIIGHKPVTMPTIASSLWTDDDPSDAVAFKDNTIAKCAITQASADDYLEFSGAFSTSLYTLAVKSTITEANSFAGVYTIQCVVTDILGAFSEPTTFTLTINPNLPVVNGDLADMDDYEIDIQITETLQYVISYSDIRVDFTKACTDPESDTITYTLEYNQATIATYPSARRNLVNDPLDPFNPTDMETLVSFDSTDKTITIDGKIKESGINTYQFSLTCKDQFNIAKVTYPFRIVVVDKDLSPTSEPQDPVFKFFKTEPFTYTIDATKFDDGLVDTFTYSLVGTKNDDKIQDVDTVANSNVGDLTATCTNGGTSCEISSFQFEALGGSAVYTNDYFTTQQRSIKGYVKAVDTAGQATYSAFIIYLTPCNGNCADCDTTDADKCTKCPTDQFLDPATYICGTCPANQFGNPSDGLCTDCNDNCLSCSSGGTNLDDDECVCDTPTNLIVIDTKECVDTCPAYYKDDGVYCYNNVQPEIISLTGSTQTSFNQLYTGSVYEFLVQDYEKDTIIKPTFTVKYNAAAIANTDSPFEIPDTISTAAPFKYYVMYDPTKFTRQMPADDDSGTNTQYEIVISVEDDDKSDDTATTYTIRAIIKMIGRNTPMLKSEYSTEFDTIFIGQCFKQDVLITSFEDDIGDRLSLNCSKKQAVGVTDNNWIDLINLGYGYRFTGDTKALNASYIGQYQFLCDITDGLHKKSYTFTLQVIENKQIIVTSLSPKTQVQNIYTTKTYNLQSLCVDPENQPITRILTVNGTAYSTQLFGSFLQWQEATGKLTFVFSSNSQGNLYQFILLCYDGINPAVNTEFNINAVANYPLVVNRAIQNQVIKFTQTSHTINITGLFTDPENITYRCYQNCQTCFEVESNNCNSCKSAFYFYQNACFSSCPDGTYQDEINRVCKPCPSSCKTCLKPTEDGDNQCITCLPGYFYYDYDCLSTCPADYYGDTVTNTCKLIENSGTPTTNLEYTECKEFLKLFTMVTDTRGVSSFTDILSETVSCAKMKKCANGQTNQPACTWNRQFAMQCSISPKSSKVTLRVATNSMPDHCFDSSVIFAQENKIDFEVRFNVKTSSLSKTSISTTTSALSYQCSSQWVDDSQLPAVYEYKGYSGTTQRVVGIALNGVPLFQGTSELQYDSLYPKSYGLYRFPKVVDVDICLGSSQYSSFYHYYSYSPCILGTTFKSNAKSVLCANVTSCKNDLVTYMQSGLSPEYKANQQIIGIAKDGHKILGPYKKGGIIWQPCDVDICNGVTQNGEYFYVMTLFHPYTINCWGPSVTSNSYKAQCSSNSYVCGETLPYGGSGGSGTSSANFLQVYFSFNAIILIMISFVLFAFE